MYETFDHTADLGLRVRAADAAELFTDAARGLFSAMLANPDAVNPVEEIAIHLEGNNLEELWHDWLSELLYVFHGRRMALVEFHVDLNLPATGAAPSENVDAETRVSPPMILNATARGEPIDPSRHQIEMEVKAVTWHQLKVEQSPEGWLGEVILDI